MSCQCRVGNFNGVGIARAMAVVIDNGSDVIDVMWRWTDGAWSVDGGTEKRKVTPTADRFREAMFIGERSDDDAMIMEEANSCERGCKEQIKIVIQT